MRHKISYRKLRKSCHGGNFLHYTHVYLDRYAIIRSIMIISLINSRGGVAKTTSVIYLAELIPEAILIDSTQDRTLEKYIIKFKGVKVDTSLRAKHKIAIVDTQPVIDSRTLRVARDSDLIIIPTTLEEWSLETAREVQGLVRKKNKNIIVLPTQYKPWSSYQRKELKKLDTIPIRYSMSADSNKRKGQLDKKLLSDYRKVYDGIKRRAKF